VPSDDFDEERAMITPRNVEKSYFQEAAANRVSTTSTLRDSHVGDATPASWALYCLLAAALLLGRPALAAPAEIGPAAKVSGGEIRGRLLPDRGGAVFKGIPFAQPPVGELRWREPQPILPWTGVRDAGESGPPCAQRSSGWNEKESIASREDCLYLDVWTPEWPAISPKPVMLWLHGGGNTGGAGASDPLYEGTRIVKRGVVLVIVDYRLGVFGFFAHPDLTRESPHRSSGNYGILDQLAALRWVHDNIAAFGGDPGNVTLFGQSAGAADVSVLMASPLAKGLFHRAIAQSGSAGQMPSLAQVEEGGRRLAERLTPPGSDPLSYLRSQSTAELLKSAGGASINVDGWLLEATPAAVFAAGQQHRIPLITGSNAIELPSQASPDDLRKAIASRYADLAPKALSLYGLLEPGSSGRPDPLYGSLNDQFAADTGFRCPAVLQGEWHSAAGNATWEYEFDRAIPPKPTVVHSSELPYVFDNLFPTGSQAGEYQEADRKLSSIIQAYWTNFAKTGDPNGADLPAWPRFEAKSRSYLELGTSGDVSVKQNQRGAFCGVFADNMRRSMSTRQPGR
jgi:para-nitrobenzyl esterase